MDQLLRVTYLSWCAGHIWVMKGQTLEFLLAQKSDVQLNFFFLQTILTVLCDLPLASTAFSCRPLSCTWWTWRVLMTLVVLGECIWWTWRVLLKEFLSRTATPGSVSTAPGMFTCLVNEILAVVFASIGFRDESKRVSIWGKTVLWHAALQRRKPGACSGSPWPSGAQNSDHTLGHPRGCLKLFLKDFKIIYTLCIVSKGSGAHAYVQVQMSC